MTESDEIPANEAFLRAYHDRTPGSMASSLLAHPMPDARRANELPGAGRAGGRCRRVLDLGCADGSLLALLARNGSTRLAGVDLSDGELAMARRRPELSDADLRTARAQQLPFADDSFDAVVSHMALMLMSDIEQVVAEVARVLNPGGRFAVAVGVGAVPGSAVELFLSLARPFFEAVPSDRRLPRMGDRRTRSKDGLDAVLAPAGFAPVTWEESSLELTGTPEQVWQVMIPSYYDMATLDDEQLVRLHEQFVSQAASLTGQLHGGTRIAIATTTRAA